MAVDDLSTVISANLGAGSSVTRQPSGGVEEIHLDHGNLGEEGTTPWKTQAVSIRLIDGTNNETIMMDNNGAACALITKRGTYFMDNTNYLEFTNNGSTGDLTFAVIVEG
jgi:hypothetical protein